jgi:hypothetical protein
MNGAAVIAEILRREGTAFLPCYPSNPLIEACAGPTWDNHVARFRNAFDNVQRVERGEPPLWVVPELAEIIR